jgi:dTDP-4-dehydrorhamnose reductase
MPPRAGDVRMNSDKLRAAIGRNPFRPWPLGDDLLPTHRHWHAQRPRGETGSFQRIVERLYRYPSDRPGEMRA